MLVLKTHRKVELWRSSSARTRTLWMALALGAALVGACQEGRDASYAEPEELGQSAAALVVNGERTQGHPAAAQLGEKRFIAWGGTDSLKRLNIISSTRPGEWGGKITFDERTNSTSGVALTVFNDRLYMGWAGPDDRLYLMSSADGETWEDKRRFDNCRTYDAPSLAVHNGRLYVAYTGTDNHLNIFWSDDGANFTQPVWHDDLSYNSPSLTSFQGMLVLAWTGIFQHLNIAELDPQTGRIRREANVNELSWDGAFVLGFGDTLIISWRGNFLNEQINHAPLSREFLDGWLNGGNRTNGLPMKVTMKETSNRTPTFANLGGSAALLWRGTDAYLNILENMYELPRADLSVALAPSASEVGVTEHLALDVAIENAGPNAAEELTATLGLPEGLAFVSCATESGVSCTHTDGSVTLRAAGLLAGRAIHATVELRASCTFEPSELDLAAQVSAKNLDPRAGNNTTNDQVIVVPSAPVLEVPAPVSANTCSLDGTSLDLGEPIVTDLCDPAPELRVRIVSEGGEAVDIPVDHATVFALCDSVVEYTVVNAAGLSATATQAVSVRFEHDDCASGACCPEGSTIVRLDEVGNAYTGRQAGECVLGTNGADTVSLAGGGGALFGGPGHDTISVGAGAYDIRGGDGNDVIAAYGGGVSLWGNAGDDVLYAAYGDNEVYPGPGFDMVSLAQGNNTIVILDVCEIEPGERIEAGRGYDVLIAPVGAEELRALGLVFEGIDEIIVDDSRRCASECLLMSERCGK